MLVAFIKSTDHLLLLFFNSHMFLLFLYNASLFITSIFEIFFIFALSLRYQLYFLSLRYLWGILLEMTNANFVNDKTWLCLYHINTVLNKSHLNLTTTWYLITSLFSHATSIFYHIIVTFTSHSACTGFTPVVCLERGGIGSGADPCHPTQE